MAAQSKLDIPKNICTERDCPLNEAGIQHDEGIYKHEGKDVEFSIVFDMSNPPPFLWEASSRFWKAMAAKDTAKGDELKEIEKNLQKDARMVAQFLNYHAGCKCKVDCKGHAHGD